jgi:Transposase IS116/IS110/IS902 family
MNVPARLRPPVSGVGGRELLARLEITEPWAAGTTAALQLIDQLDVEFTAGECALRRLGVDPRYVPLLMTIPGIGWVLRYTIAAEIGDIPASPARPSWPGTPGCARGSTSLGKDHRGPLSRNGPKYLSWALIEAATHAAATRSTPNVTDTPRPGWAANAAPRSPRSNSPIDSRRRSGTCCPPTDLSPWQAPPILWPSARRADLAAGSSCVQVVVLAAAGLRGAPPGPTRHRQRAKPADELPTRTLLLLPRPSFA